MASLEFRNQHQRSDSTATAADGGIALSGPVVNQSNKFHMVCLNGARILMDEVALCDNDQISLHGDKYNYLVHLVEGVRVLEPDDLAMHINAATLASRSFAVKL